MKEATLIRFASRTIKKLNVKTQVNCVVDHKICTKKRIEKIIFFLSIFSWLRSILHYSWKETGKLSAFYTVCAVSFSISFALKKILIKLRILPISRFCSKGNWSWHRLWNHKENAKCSKWWSVFIKILLLFFAFRISFIQ